MCDSRTHRELICAGQQLRHEFNPFRFDRVQLDWLVGQQLGSLVK